MPCNPHHKPWEDSPQWQQDRRELLAILKSLSFRQGTFTLASGKVASYYVDCRMTTLSARGAYLIGRLLYPQIQSLQVDAVGGMSIGADPVVSALTYRSAEVGDVLNGFLVRKEMKQHGTGRQIEGHIAPWMRVVLVEDVVTTGKSVLKAVEAIQNTSPSIHITGVVSLVDREEGGAETLKQVGLELSTLYSIQEFFN